jgi:C4-dicarboxylate transporter DctM subunit
MPVIIVGGIWSGLFTPTEAAAVAVVYGLIMSLVLYRDITWRDLPQMLLRSLRTSSVVMLIVGATGALAWLITAEQVAVQLAAWVTSVAHRPWEFLLLVNIFFAAAWNVHRAAAGVAVDRSVVAAHGAGIPH